MKTTIRWPRAVYFDASALIELPRDLASSELVQVQSFARKLGIGLFVPEVAAKEWVFNHQQKVRKQYDSMVNASRSIGNYLQREPLGYE